MDTCEQVLAAQQPQELFGSNEKRAKNIYRNLMRRVHPDMFSDAHEKDTASQAFNHLTGLWEIYQSKTGSQPADTGTIRTKKHEYSLGEVVGIDDIYARYRATYDAGHESCELLVTKQPNDADLTENYVTSLRKLNQEVPVEFRAFYPTFVESFRYRTEDNIDHASLTQNIPEGFSQFNKILEIYPAGIGGRDIAWIFKRMLTAVGNAHDVHIVHGAPSLDNFYIHPAKHGVILSNWAYSVEAGNKMKAMPTATKEDYPSYVFDKQPVNYALDINLCAKTARKLLRKDAPKQLFTFFKVCERTNPMEAKHLLAEFNKMLERLYGKPKFHPFTLNP